MHAVVVTVTISDREAAERVPREQLVLWASHTPEFVTGYWTIKDDNGLTMLMYETEDPANSMSEQVKGAVPGAVTLDNVEVREVAAHAGPALGKPHVSRRPCLKPKLRGLQDSRALILVSAAQRPSRVTRLGCERVLEPLPARLLLSRRRNARLGAGDAGSSLLRRGGRATISWRGAGSALRLGRWCGCWARGGLLSSFRAVGVLVLIWSRVRRCRRT
jgi:hypothetical protein